MTPDMRERTGMTTINICPACGYPKFGPGLCAYCVPVQAMSGGYTFESMPGAEQPRFSPALASGNRRALWKRAGSNPALQAG
jgi:hypothetical protein